MTRLRKLLLLLLSLILPSCIIVPKRELANINSQVHNPTISIPNDFKVVSENVNIKASRGRICYSGTNSFRKLKLLTYSNASSISYHIKIEVQNNNLL